MASKHWTLDDVPWDQINPSLVDSSMLAVVKAAALVEFNAEDYANHLCLVFEDDPDFQDLAREWAAEEVKHGVALGRWSSLIDPGYSFAVAVERFRSGYSLPAASEHGSLRGSKAGELVARCMVETGTSSFYSAVGDATEEPVLRYLCRHIAADEFRHYKLFLTYQNLYLKREHISRLRRLCIAVSRIAETQDDELAYAYHAANYGADDYNRVRAASSYELHAFSLYRQHHIERAAGMAIKACGLSTRSVFASALRWASWWFLSNRLRRIEKRVV
ncbi:MAG: ferritin-like domain-containing protein [Rhodospirillaceae bacterium]